MRLIYLTSFFVFAAGICHGENFIFKDGNQIAGTLKSVTAQTLEIKTSSGIIKVNRNDVALIDFSKDTAARKIICKTTPAGSGTVQKTYYADGKKMASETLDNRGNVVSRTGKIPDGVVEEYYSDKQLKSEKFFRRGKANGLFKAYYTDGRLHTQAYYLDNNLHGLVKIYGESGYLLLEQNFKAGVPDGFQREYDEDGSLKSELFYREGRLASQGSKPVPPGTAAAQPGAVPDIVKAQLPLAVAEISIKTKRLARGTRHTFYRNGKHIGTQVLDKNYNVTRRSGKIPDGIIRTYFKNGLPEIEMVFLNDKLNGPTKFYDESGKLKSEVIYKDNKVINRKPAP